MFKHLLLLTSCIVILGASSLARAAQATAPAKTPAGNSIKAPPDWRATERGRLLRLDAPEGDLTVAIVDVGAAADARAAAAAAWAAFRPAEPHTPSLVTQRPARRGWDERVAFDYDTSARQHLERYATALRHRDAWTVIIVDGSEATAEKRYSGIAQAQGSLIPAGYVRETFAGRTAHPLDAQRVQALREFVETSMKALEIPGAAFALIDHGKVVSESGFGVKRLGAPAPVDPRTLFMVASNTKGMTTLLLAELVDQGRLRWDEPVTQAYPASRLGDAATTAAVRIRDLVCACTGLPRGDMDWVFDTPASLPATATFTQLSRMQPTSKFGTVFQYNNQMASAAGYIAGHLYYPRMELGNAYDRAMREHVFLPLGMDSTTFSFRRALAGDAAQPHGETIDGRPQVSSLGADEIAIPFRPSAGAWSSAHDMIRYVALELSGGLLPDGRRLVSEQNLLARRARGVSTGANQWYGMGLWETADSGVSVIHHGGNMPGYRSDILVIPSAQVGAVILTNASRGGALVSAFQRRLQEVLYDGRPEAAEDVAFSARQMKDEARQERSRLILPVDPRVTAQLAPRYQNPELGTLQVRTDSTGIRVVTSSFDSHVATRKSDDGSVSVETIDPGFDGFQFVVGEEAGRRTLTLRDGQHAYVFRAVS